MFTRGQQIFAIVFFISFVILIAWQYRKDAKKNPNMFKGWYWVLLFIVFVMAIYQVIIRIK